MDHVSRPVLIALVAAIALVGVRFTVMRPKDDSGSPPAAATAPGQTGLQNAVDKANNAVGTNNGAVKRHEQAANGATPGDATTPTKAKAVATPKAKPAAALPKLAEGDRSGPILQNLADGKVVVALFFNPHGADDNAALRAVRSANRRHGRVIVHSIEIEDVGDYNALTTGVQVLEAPTILVIGPDHKARTVVGYTDVKEIDQAVFDAVRAAKKHTQR